MLSALFFEVVSFESELPAVMFVTCTRDRSKLSSTQSLQVMKVNSARQTVGVDVKHPNNTEAGVVPVELPPG